MATHITRKNKPGLTIGNTYFFYLKRTEQVAGVVGFKTSCSFKLAEIHTDTILASWGSNRRIFNRDRWGAIDRYSRERVSLR